MAETSPEGVTVDRLVAQAGFTRGAFYSNFSSMDEVYAELFEQQTTLLIDTMRNALADAPDRELGSGLVEHVLAALRPHGDRWFLLNTELVLQAVRDEGRRETYLAFHRRFRAELADALGAELERTGRRAIPSLDVLAEVVAVLYMRSLADEGLVPGGPNELVGVLPTVILSLSEPI